MALDHHSGKPVIKVKNSGDQGTITFEDGSTINVWAAVPTEIVGSALLTVEEAEGGHNLIFGHTLIGASAVREYTVFVADAEAAGAAESDSEGTNASE